jgi:transcriptional regulator with XRE-family HTH domain
MAIQVLQTRRLLASGEARRIRELAGLSLSDVAADIGVTGSAVYRWERGERVPRGRAAADYAVLLLAMRELVDRTCSATS